MILPDHNKIAWAWLDDLINRAERALHRNKGTAPADLPPATRMTPRAREAILEDTYEKIKKMLIGVVKEELGPVQHAEVHFARRAGLDPLYFNWFIVNGKHWPPMPKKTNQALYAIQNVYLWYGALPDDWNHMVVPDMSKNRDRDHALQDFGKWFLATALPKIEQQYLREIWKQSQDLVHQFRGKDAPRDPKAPIMLKKDFEFRLVADRFQLKPAIQEVVDLFS